MFAVFTRTFWKDNPSWPNGLEPECGPRTYLAKGLKTEEEARAMCKKYNATHDPGRYSRKAEYEET